VDLEAKIDEVLRWKLEAATEKLLDRVVQSEAKQNSFARHLANLADETQSELSQIKSTIVTVAGDILENVQTQILPQAEMAQNDALAEFRTEFQAQLQS
jgi:uncharacterized protein YfcZ (UPF0381/DUF406 family)